MINHQKYSELVKQARLGDKKCMNRLAEEARVHLREYVFRLTLREDLTQDIVQESILEMFKVFNKLKRADRFLAWLDGIAFNKVRSHYGRQWRHKTISLSDIDCELAANEGKDALADMVHRELKQIVIKSMHELAPRYRAVLIMRCYRQMQYSEIARLIGCTEFGAQSLFYRAKKALAKKLSGHGLGKEYLLTALVLFGKLTATTEAAAANISVTSSILKVGTAATLAAVATSKTAIISLTAAGLIAGGTAAVTHGTSKVDNQRQIPGTQRAINTPVQTEENTNTQQQWYFFPEGVGKPVMMRLLEYDSDGGHSSCKYLQNQLANYYYDDNTIYINNCRMYNPDLSVARLPTDGEDLSRFISLVEGKKVNMEYVSGKGNGLLIISKRSSEHGDRIWRTDRHFNVLQEEYFQFNWPQSTRVVDHRDAMHKRGWTYFRIDGQINGMRISGTGRLPFVYATSRRFSPWFDLRLADGSKIIDTPRGAYVLGQNSEVIARYGAKSFFAGLGRPWMGLHTLDTIRRDAVENQVWFETKNLPDDNKTEIILTKERLKLVYTIDMEKDIVEKITFTNGDGDEGELRFSYLQDIDDTGEEFTMPRVAGFRTDMKNSPGILWFANLLNNRW